MINWITRKQVLAFMVLCLLVTAVLRLPSLATIPPGLHYDEAANGVLAGDIAFRGYRPLFITSFTGKEVLFFYLASGVMALIGESVLALRLAAAFVGVLTVAAAYWLGYELLRDRRVAALAAALIAVSFWHLLLSRLGFRAITQPLLQALTTAALLRGLRRDEWRWLMVAGVGLGLAAYTYLAVRLFPVLLLLALLPVWWQREKRYWRWLQLGLAVLLGLTALSPLLYFFITNPDTFWTRINQVAPGAGADLGVGESYLKSLGMLFLAGDPYWRFNLPQRPLFSWFWGGLLVVGWIITAWRLWQGYRSRFPLVDWQKSALLLLLLAPFIMILPTALATGEIVPSNLRAIGLAPFIFYLPAIGLLALVGDLQRRLRLPLPIPLGLFAGLVVLLLGGLFTDRLYFRAWATAPEVYFESDGDLTAVAHYLDNTDLSDKTVYVATPHYQHPTLAFLSEQYDRIKWLPGSKALVFPAEGAALYVYPHNSPLPDWAAPYVQADLPLFGGSNGETAFDAYALGSPPELAIPNAVNANFGDTITLLGYQVGDAKAGGTLPVTLFWRVADEPTADFIPFVHLEDQWQTRWAQAEPFAYPAAQWQAGETIIQRVELNVPSGAPPGNYRLRVGLFVPATGDRLPRLDAEGRYAGPTLTIEDAAITVAGQLPADRPQPPHVLNEEVRSGLFLVGYERGGETVATGETLNFVLWWQAIEPQPSLITRVELMRADNTGRILANTQPVHGAYPFSEWATPIFLRDHQSLRVPDNLTPGQYRLQVRILDEADESLAKVELGSLVVEKTERVFDAPAMQERLDAAFSDEIRLLGYTLEPAGESQYTLSLVWQAMRPPTADYTVFVHLLGQDGGCCLWQQDVMPRQDQYPTSRWLADEVVVDTYQIQVPADAAPGRYPLEIGLYLAEHGRRLRVSGLGVEGDDAVYLPPLVVE